MVKRRPIRPMFLSEAPNDLRGVRVLAAQVLLMSTLAHAGTSRHADSTAAGREAARAATAVMVGRLIDGAAAQTMTITTLSEP